MAIYHLSCQVISRKSGRSSVAASAYRAGARIADARTGLVHDYTRKGGVTASALFVPDNAPEAWRPDPEAEEGPEKEADTNKKRAALWNAVEASERRGDARLCREFNVALPRELTEDERWELAQRFARSLAEQGMCVDLAMHDPEGGGNPHFHAMATMRPCDASGFLPKTRAVYLMRNDLGAERWKTAKEAKALGHSWAKVYQYKDGTKRTMAEAEAAGLDPTKDRKRKQPVSKKESATEAWDSKEALEGWRESWQEMANEALEHAGSKERIDHRSNEARGIDDRPTRHEGVAVRAMERRAAEEAGEAHAPVTQKAAENADIRAENARAEARRRRRLEAPPTIGRDDAAADLAALAEAIPEAVEALDAMPSQALELEEAARPGDTRGLAGDWYEPDPAGEATAAANDAMGSAWESGARTVRALFEAALSALRSYVARLLVLMEQRRREGDAVTREEAARWALSHEPDAPRPGEPERQPAEDWQLQRELGLSLGGRSRQRTPGL